MSASTKRKNRQAEIDAGTYRKTLSQQKEDKKKKKEKIKWIIVCSILVLFFIFVALLKTGVLYRSFDGITISYEANETLGISAGERSFSVAECNYFYNSRYLEIVNMLGQYGGLSSLDTSEPMDEMFRSWLGAEEGITWNRYFLNSAEDTLRELAILNEYAEAKGIALDAADTAEIDATISTIETNADASGLGSTSKYLAYYYGKGVNASVVRDIMEMQTLARKALQSISDSFEYTPEQLAEKYDTVKDSYDTFTYDYYLIAVEQEEAGIEDYMVDTAEDAAVADAAAAEKEDSAALVEARNTAQAILKEVAGGKDLSAAVAATVEDENASVSAKQDVAGSETEPTLTEWLMSADRKDGDVDVVEGADGVYVAVFHSRDNGQHKTDESGDMNYCDYVAKQLLSSEDLSKWEEENIHPVSEAAKLSEGFAIRYVGKSSAQG